MVNARAQEGGGQRRTVRRPGQRSALRGPRGPVPKDRRESLHGWRALPHSSAERLRSKERGETRETEGGEAVQTHGGASADGATGKL